MNTIYQQVAERTKIPDFRMSDCIEFRGHVYSLDSLSVHVTKDGIVMEMQGCDVTWALPKEEKACSA